MTDKARYEASKLFAYHPCRIVMLKEDGDLGNMHYYKSREALEADAKSFTDAGFVFQVEL